MTCSEVMGDNKDMKRKKALAIGFVIFFLFGCAHVVPKEVRKTVDQDIDIKALFKEPDAYRGKTVMLGGEILQLQNRKDGTYIEVLQRQLSSYGRPIIESKTLGRFMVLSKEFLDPAVFKKGKLLTVVGKVSGTIRGTIGEVEYRYPLIEATNLYLLERRSGPSVGVGIGFGFYHGF
ncbi:MAG: Slp family lipoprotein [Nitrospirae bacterium]|nr:MAG: Slp family lipoprotein [Nitrospirota bacterium]